MLTESWVRILYVGKHTLPSGEKFDVDLDLLKEIENQTNQFILACEEMNPSSPYRLPVIREHKMRGSRDGSILRLRIEDQNLFALIRWTVPTWHEIKEGSVQNVSPRIDGSYVSSWGVEYGPLIREVSLTVSPVLEALGSIQETLNLRLSRHAMNEEELEMSQEEEDMELNQEEMSLDQKVDRILEILSELKAHLSLSQGEEEDMEMSQEEEQAPLAEVQALEERIQVLEDELALSRKQRLNTKERGAQTLPAKAPKSVEDCLELGRKQGLKGTALAQFAMDHASKLGIK